MCDRGYTCFECEEREERKLEELKLRMRIAEAEASNRSPFFSPRTVVVERRREAGIDDLFNDIFGTRRVVVERPVVVRTSIVDPIDVMLGMAAGTVITEGARALGNAVRSGMAAKKAKNRKEKK